MASHRLLFSSISLISLLQIFSSSLMVAHNKLVCECVCLCVCVCVWVCGCVGVWVCVGGCGCGGVGVPLSVFQYSLIFVSVVAA
jgi:hypothetical protein